MRNETAAGVIHSVQVICAKFDVTSYIQRMDILIMLPHDPQNYRAGYPFWGSKQIWCIQTPCIFITYKLDEK